MEGHARVDPEHTGGTACPIWESRCVPQEELEDTARAIWLCLQPL